MAQKFLTDIEVTRGLVDSSGDLGVAGQVLSSTGSGTNWITNEANSTVVYLDEFTGDNSTVDFTISVSVTDENITQVYIDGVYQNKDTYSVSGTTLTFSTAPPLNADIEVITFSTATTSDDLAAGSVIIPVKNTHTASIAKGEPVYITGNVGSSARLEIAPADASNSSKMPAAGLLLQTLAVNAEGYVITGGYLRNITTDTIDGTSTSSNDTVYVKSGGGLTMTKPTGTNLIQNIAKVARSASGNAGSLLVSSILRTNDVPNITNDYFWLGNSSGVATPTEFTSTARGLLSVGAEGTAAGDGNLAYNNSSGVFTYTPPVLGGLSGTTDNITEGSTNLYYTDARSRSSISAGGDLSYSSTTGVMSYTTPTTIASLSNHDTDDLSEGATNLYYTDTRVGTYLTNNSYATQSYVNTQVSNLVDSAPSTLDTLNELAAALGDDANFSTTVTNSIATKLPLAGGTLTGGLTGTTATFNGKVGAGLSPSTSLHVSGSALTNNVAAYIGGGWVGNDAYHKEGGLLVISGTNTTQTGAGIAFQTRNTANTNYHKGSMIMDRDGALSFELGGQGTSATSEKFKITAAGNATLTGDLTVSGNNVRSKIFESHVGHPYLDSDGTSHYIKGGNSGANILYGEFASFRAGGPVYPTSDNSYSLGSSSLAWSNFYANNAYASILYDKSNTAYYAYPSSQSVFYRLKLQGTGTANAATLEIDNPSTSSFIHTGELFTANQTAGQANIFVIGKSGSTKNSGYIGYNWASNSSNNNYITFGQWGADHLFRIYGDQVLSTVTLRSDVDMHAPTFYDKNNTSYYAHLDSTTTSINAAGAGAFASHSSTSRVLNLEAGTNNGNIIQFLRSGVNKWELVGREGTFYIYKNDGSGSGMKWQIDTNGNHSISGNATFTTDVRSPIFYDTNNTAYYTDPNSTSVMNQINLYVGGLQMLRGNNYNAIWWAANNDDNHVLWNDYYGGPSTRGGANSGFDGIKWNTYRGLHIRGGSAGAYNCIVVTNTGSNTNTHTVALYAHDDEVLKTTNSSNNGIIVQRDLYLSGSTGGSTGNQLVIGQTSESLAYTLQDTNTRPLIYMTGQYPALTLNHTVTSNTNHGPTIQYTHNGSGARQWVHGSSGDGEHFFFGYSDSSQGNSNYNPHNGIAGYLGTSMMTFKNNGYVGIGGDWGGLGSGDPAYAIDTKGTLHNNTDVRAPIFYDSNNTNFYVDTSNGGTNTSINASGVIRGNYFVGTNYAADGYTIYKGYDNWNHYIVIRGLANPGSSKAQSSISGGHQTSFVEYAENNASTGWFFVGSAGSTYEQIAKITKSHSEFVGSARAPLFYDTNNTQYYADPASNSNLYSISLYNISTISRLQSGGNLNGQNNFAFGNTGTLGSATSNSNNNAAIGHSSQASNSTGDNNFSFGYASLYSLSSGSNNIAMGDATGYNVTSGSNNLLFGHNAGRTGYQTPQSIAGVTTGSNQIHMGNESHTTARIQISWTVNSDARDKTDVTPIDVGLDFVNQLNPVTFRWDKRSDYEDRTPTGENKLEELTLGFLAQEVEEVEKSYGYDVATKTNLVVDRDVEQDHFGITYEKMIPILTKAIQELTQEVQTLKDQINGIN